MAAEFGLYYPPWNWTGKTDDLLERVAGEVGIEHVTIPVVTGEVTQFRLNRVHDEPYFHTEGGWHFPPRGGLYKGSIRPVTARWFGKRDVLARICERAKDAGLQVFFRVDTDKLVRPLVDHVHLRQKNAWGQDITSLPPCAGNPELRELVRATLEDLERYEPAGFQVPGWYNRWGFPPERLVVRGALFHVWPESYICFCASCRQIAASAGVDPEQTARSVRVHAGRVGDSLDGIGCAPHHDRDEVLEGYYNACAGDHCAWLDRLANSFTERRRFCIWPYLNKASFGPTSWTAYLERFSLSTWSAEGDSPWLKWMQELGVTATCLEVGGSTRGGGAQLVNGLSRAVETGIAFFDFEGVEESPTEAVTWLKQAVRYARRAGTS